VQEKSNSITTLISSVVIKLIEVEEHCGVAFNDRHVCNLYHEDCKFTPLQNAAAAIDMLGEEFLLIPYGLS